MNPKPVYLIFVVLSYSLTACGVSTPGGFVLGTSGYLEEFNRGRQASGERIPERDRTELAAIVRGGR